MTVKRVPVDNIRPNPFLEFLTRRALDTESESARRDDDGFSWHDGGTIESLAEAIRSEGLLSPLRGRQRNGHVELCFGHRRLAAVKLLGWTEVNVDVVKIDDAAMSVGSMLENLHRKDLDRIQRAESVVTAVEKLMEKGDDQASAREKVKTMLGVSDAFMSVQFTIAREFDQVEKDLVRKGKIPVTNAVEAHHAAGTPFVTQAADQHYSLRKIRRVERALSQPRDPKIRSKLIKDLLEGKLPLNEVPREARRRAGRNKKNDAPPDTAKVLSEWSSKLQDLTKDLKDLAPYREFVDTAPKKVANRFRKAVQAVTSELKPYLH